jgi:hypothetical protein
MFRRIPWQEVCKFLAGAFFVNAGILFYLYLARVSVPLLCTNFIETPEISGVRSIVHAALFLTFFYLGFIRKWKRHSILTYDQDDEKIREVVATWMRATAEGDLETVLSLMAEDAVFLLPDQPPMRGREAFAAASVRPSDKSVSKASRIFRRVMSLELRLLLESAVSDGDSSSGRACPTARWSDVVSLPQRARRTLDPLSRCEHALSSMKYSVPQLSLPRRMKIAQCNKMIHTI